MLYFRLEPEVIFSVATDEHMEGAGVNIDLAART
jgi:hypothetical protein